MLRDVVRFRRLGYELLESADSATLGSALASAGLGEGFVRDYLVPMTAAIWSAPADEILEYPATSMLRFLHNHGLIDITGRPKWRTVSNGSRSYVEKVARHIEEIRLSDPVLGVDRTHDGVTVTSRRGTDRFDHIVLASHSDQALRILGGDAAPEERETLGALRYEPNEVVLHTDRSLMPRRRRLWSSWNYLTDRSQRSTKTSVTYWMNRLQNLETSEPVFVSLNPLHAPRPETILGSYSYAHPQFDLAAVAAQGRITTLQGVRRTWFAGAYLGYGFHEDGLQAGFNVAAALGSPPPWHDEVVPRSSAPSIPILTS